MTSQHKRCPFFYHSPSNPFAEQCALTEGHTGNHMKPQLMSASPNTTKQTFGWIKRE